MTHKRFIQEMACRLLSGPSSTAMPVDTMFGLGSSPPVTLPLFTQRFTTTSFMYVTSEKSLHSIGVHVVKQKEKLRPCLSSRCQTVQPPERKSTDRLLYSSDSERVKAMSVVGDFPVGDVSSNGTATQAVRAASKSTKRVCFADSKGLALEAVRIMEGSSNVPPIFRSRLQEEIVQDEKPALFHSYMYAVDFEQPSANYLEFRDNLERNCIGLENVLIQNNKTVVGTVKVKNIAFEKSVTVRITFNGWKTCTEIAAAYVQQSSSGKIDRYDNFSFSFDLPANKHAGESVEFCLHYRCNGQSYWDSSGGKNYRIIAQHENGLTEEQKMASYYSLSSTGNWGDFSFWKLMDERPYW